MQMTGIEAAERQAIRGLRSPRKGRFERMFVVQCWLISALFLFMAAGVAARTASVAYLINTGAWRGDFCTKNPNITVVHDCEHVDAHSSCAIGHTLLTGYSGNVYRLGGGNAVIAPGCYSQTLANTTVVGYAKAISAVWYD